MLKYVDLAAPSESPPPSMLLDRSAGEYQDGHGDEVEAPDGAGVGQPPAELHQVGLRQDPME